MARLWRVFHPGLPGEPGAEVELAREEAHHVGRVLRLGAGERVSLFDGAGREWEAVILPSAPPERLLVRLERERTDAVEAPVEILLYQALCRPDRMDWLVQKATEIGVSAVCPLLTVRAERTRAAEKRLERWRRIAIEAAKQCGRRRVPDITPCDDLPAAGPDGPPALLLSPGSAARPLGELLREGPARQVLLAVGPEGGFSAEEVRRWGAAGWRPADLGPRILRAETAGIVAASLVLHAWGDLGRAV